MTPTTTNRTYADRLAEFSIQLAADRIPATVVRQAELSVLDYLGVAVAGSKTPAATIVGAYILSSESAGQATLIGTRERAAAALAAMANGTRAHSIELDDHEAHHRSKVHSGAVVMSAAWAAAEMVGGVTGSDFLASVIVGYDVFGRLSGATPYPDFLGKTRGFHTTPLFGPFAAAATASRLFGLSPHQLSNAFGIAGSLCSGLQETVSAGAMVKPFHAGWAAHSGIVAAQLASRDYTGPRSIFEGRRGYFRAYCGEGNYNLDVIDDSFGVNFDMSLTMYKPYACAGGIHPSLTAIDRLRADNDFAVEDVVEVVVRTSEHVVDTFVTPHDAKYSPRTGPQAQHSLPYAAAALLMDGVALIEQFTDQAVLRPAVQALAQRITVEVDPTIHSDDPEDEPAGVTIRLADRRELVLDVRGGKGSLAVPMSEQELSEKYRRLASPVLGEDVTDGIERRVLKLHADENVSDLPAGLWARR